MERSEQIQRGLETNAKLLNENKTLKHKTHIAMNETFKNSLKGFKVKGVFIVLGALIVIALSANAFNSGIGFYVFCGIVAILCYIAFVIVSILKNKQEYETLENAKITNERILAEKAAQRKAFEKQIEQLQKERNDAEFALAQEKAKAKETAKMNEMLQQACETKNAAYEEAKAEAAKAKAQSKAKKQAIKK